MRFNGAEITVKLLERHGINVVAGIPGGSNLPIYDALYSSSIKHILVRHEQAAGFVAQGIARSTGKAAVCIATSGPGVTNLITSIADAKLDSIPVVAITGQVAYSSVGSDAFQEVDAYGLTLPIVKHSFLVRDVSELLTVIPEAFSIAQSGRPGPVLIDIPKDVQLAQFEFESWPENMPLEKDPEVNFLEIVKAADMINKAKKPVLFIGGGAVNSDASSAIHDLAVISSIPVVSTLMGLGCFPAGDPLNLGIVGMHGAQYTNIIMEEADLVIALGVRFDERSAGDASRFCENASIIHIDIDPAEINKIKPTHLSIVGDIKKSLERINTLVNEDHREDWIGKVNGLKEMYPFVISNPEDKAHPVNFIIKVSEHAPKDSIITTDVGQHQMWTAQAYPFSYDRQLLTSGGLGTMGFGLPAAIGAALANPDKQVMCFSGDGSILMNLQELATLADLELNIKLFILNNGHLGLVRQLQELFYKEHYYSTRFIKNPDFKTIAAGFGIDSINLDNPDEFDERLGEIFSSDKPFVINVPVDYRENVLPIVPPGSANYEMIGV